MHKGLDFLDTTPDMEEASKLIGTNLFFIGSLRQAEKNGSWEKQDAGIAFITQFRPYLKQLDLGSVYLSLFYYLV